jgi:hypothetical protein
VLACVLDGPKHRTSLLILGAAMLLTQLNQHVLTAMLKSGSPLLGLIVLARNALLLTWGIRVLRMDRGGDAARPLPRAEMVGAS